MKTLYFECTSGISGDMTVAALLDLGADQNAVREGLESLGVDGYRIEIGRAVKSGIDACDFRVILEHEHSPNYETAHAHPHGGHEHGEHDGHGHPHGHTHDDEHNEHNEHYEHGHRNLGDITAIIEASGISRGAKDIAIKIFGVVAEAEAKVHGLPVNEVHFHEVGAVDSIVDIVGAAICVDNLGAGRVICSPLREGTGTVKCRHGVMPVPAPATLEIMRSHDIPLVITDNNGEMVTPTGAAIIAALAEGFEPPKNAIVRKVGYGAGKREFKTANVLRAMLLEESPAPENTGGVLKMECNLDDMTGEELSYACEKLMQAGALDVWTSPIFMKKGRPGYMLSVLCAPSNEKEMSEIIFKHTSTIGVRTSLHPRLVMERSSETAATEYGPVTLKTSVYGQICKSKPEFEDLKKLADENGASISQISRSAYNI